MIIENNKDYKDAFGGIASTTLDQKTSEELSNIDKIAKGVKNIPICITLEDAKIHVTQVFIDVFGEKFNLDKDGANMLVINALSKALYERECKIINDVQ